MKSNRGIIDPLTMGLVAGLLVGAFGAKWAPFEFMRPKPPTAELAKLQGDLAKSQADAEKAIKDKDAAIALERQKLSQEVRSAQQDGLGAKLALGRIQNQTSEVKLAASMLNRVSLKLTSAIGALPQADQDAMIQLIDEALSGKQSEIDLANAKLAQRDAEFATLKAQTDQVRSQIPVLTERAVKAEETAKATQIQVTVKTNEVAVFADKLDAEKRATGSLGGALNSAKNTLLVVGALAALGYGLFLWSRWKFAGFPKAVAAGINELRAKGVIPPKGESNVFDAFLNRHEQSQISEHTQ